jgi:hypothetical protein
MKPVLAAFLLALLCRAALAAPDAVRPHPQEPVNSTVDANAPGADPTDMSLDHAKREFFSGDSAR